MNKHLIPSQQDIGQLQGGHTGMPFAVGCFHPVLETVYAIIIQHPEVRSLESSQTLS